MNIYKSYLIVSDVIEYSESNTTVDVFVKVREIGSFGSEGLFLSFLEGRGKKLINCINQFFALFFNEGFAEEVVMPSLRLDVSEIKIIGQSEEIFIKEDIIEVYLEVNGYDYSEQLREYLEEHFILR